MGFEDMPYGNNDSNKIEKNADDENWGELKNVQIAKKEIEQLLEEGGNEKRISKCIYKMLTTRSSFAVSKEKANGDLAEVMRSLKEQQAWYRDVKKEIVKNVNKSENFEWNSNPGWIGINTRPEAEKKGNSVKVYATIPVVEYNFVQHVVSLANDLREVAEETDDNINVKVPESLTVFLAHNDSIVIHFKNRDNVEKIQRILKQWMDKNLITDAPRELGRTKVAVDPKGGGSFTEIIANHIADWVDGNSGEYDNKALAGLAVKYAIEQAQKTPA